jgi:hypothetical protein
LETLLWGEALGAYHEDFLRHGIAQEGGKGLLLHTVDRTYIGRERMDDPPMAIPLVEDSRMGKVIGAIVQPFGNHITEEAIATTEDDIPRAKGVHLGRGEAKAVFVLSHLPLFLLRINIKKEMVPPPKQ